MSQSELAQLVAMLRSSGPDLTAPPAQLRADFTAMVGAAPLSSELHFEPTALGGVPALSCMSPGTRVDRCLLYLHGGAFVIGSAQDYRSLFGELGRATGVRAVAPDYRLAPEHPFPAAIHDVLAAYRALLAEGRPASSIVVAGDSAGGALVTALLVGARDAGLPMPAGALLISPWVDLACEGRSMSTKALVDPSITREGLLIHAALYLGRQPAETPLASPLYADLAGLPPLLVQVGTAEILLDDALRLAARAAEANVRVSLSVWPDMPHVWHFFGFMLEEGRRAIGEAAEFLRARLGE
ncbi:MAG TPA: alpha/beta hydrolase [Steroidobacteraceae bacterium]|nr:alpha/beta hydrolase [Steroidobacteraceae bacterium]